MSDSVDQQIIADLRTENVWLRKQLQQYKADAARYRWMRDEMPEGSGDIASLRGVVSSETVDAEIDRAMREGA